MAVAVVTLRHGFERQNVADFDLSLLAAVDELAVVHALHSDEVLLLLAVAVCRQPSSHHAS